MTTSTPHGSAAASDAAPAPETATEERPARPPARGVQVVKFSFYRVRDEVRMLPPAERAELGRELLALIEGSGREMLTRAYSTIGTRADTDFLLWQVHDDLAPIQRWHSRLLASRLGGALARPHSYLSMTMRSMYSNPLHPTADGAPRERLRDDGGVDDYLFVYPMAKTREWYRLPRDERQRMMEQHIATGHRYHGIKINTTYSYGLDDQEFVVAFEGNDPGEFLALVRELRDSDASAYTKFDTPMFTCRRLAPRALLAEVGLLPASESGTR
jgi:chlorite dismutase